MTNINTPVIFSDLMTSFGGRNAALIMSGEISMAEAFYRVYGEDTENNGWYGRTLSRYPFPQEAKELDGEYFTSMWGWEFPDGSCLYLTPGQVGNTVSISR
jgi:hypothetical protein